MSSSSTGAVLTLIVCCYAVSYRRGGRRAGNRFETSITEDVIHEVDLQLEGKNAHSIQKVPPMFISNILERHEC